MPATGGWGPPQPFSVLTWYWNGASPEASTAPTTLTSSEFTAKPRVRVIVRFPWPSSSNGDRIAQPSTGGGGGSSLPTAAARPKVFQRGRAPASGPATTRAV